MTSKSLILDNLVLEFDNPGGKKRIRIFAKLSGKEVEIYAENLSMEENLVLNIQVFAYDCLKDLIQSLGGKKFSLNAQEACSITKFKTDDIKIKSGNVGNGFDFRICFKPL